MRSDDSMKVRTVVFLSFMILIFVFSSGAANTVGGDHLWEKAFEIAATNENWIPGYVIHNEEVFSRLGIRKERTETHSLLARHDGRDVEVTFLKVLQNGRDITGDFITEFGESIILEEEDYRVEHPFRSSCTVRVDSEESNERQTINGRECVSYRITYENERGLWEGEAWIEAESGIPVAFHGILQSVPRDEKWYTLESLEVSTFFMSTESGDWYPEYAIVDSDIEVVIRLKKTYRGRIKETYTFSDYWRYE
jgi:hypothetical protein